VSDLSTGSAKHLFPFPNDTVQNSRLKAGIALGLLAIQLVMDGLPYFSDFQPNLLPILTIAICFWQGMALL
jgi:hypothetical protein